MLPQPEVRVPAPVGVGGDDVGGTRPTGEAGTGPAWASRMTTLVTSVWASSADVPFSRPLPDCSIPPNGTDRSVSPEVVIQMMPRTRRRSCWSTLS